MVDRQRPFNAGHQVPGSSSPDSGDYRCLQDRLGGGGVMHSP